MGKRFIYAHTVEILRIGSYVEVLNTPEEQERTGQLYWNGEVISSVTNQEDVTPCDAEGKKTGAPEARVTTIYTVLPVDLEANDLGLPTVQVYEENLREV